MTQKLIFLVLIMSLSWLASCNSPDKGENMKATAEEDQNQNPEKMDEKILHTVVFSLKHPTGSDAAEDFLDDARELLTSIPGVEEFEVRRQISPKSGFHYGFSMKFADRETYTQYNEHPVHVDFVENRWNKEVTDFQELDFVIIR